MGTCDYQDPDTNLASCFEKVIEKYQLPLATRHASAKALLLLAYPEVCWGNEVSYLRVSFPTENLGLESETRDALKELSFQTGLVWTDPLRPPGSGVYVCLGLCEAAFRERVCKCSVHCAWWSMEYRPIFCSWGEQLAASWIRDLFTLLSKIIICLF